MTDPLYKQGVLPVKNQLCNWAGNLKYSTANVFYPTNLQEVQEVVKQCRQVKPLGTRHCFNAIADSEHNLISLTELNKVVSLNRSAQTVTVEGGIQYGILSPYLHEQGYALHNLASLPHISVGGSIATATHGSGVGNGNLATAVTALEMVTADGNVVQLSKATDGNSFRAAVVGLGALGVITKVTLQIEPTYTMHQHVYEMLPIAQLTENFDAIVSAGYSVSLFTDWQSDCINEVWLKSRSKIGEAHTFKSDLFGAKAAVKNLHPIAHMSAENCTEQMGVDGTWFERLPHFKMGFTPSSGVELQSEYLVAHQNAVEAILAVYRLGKQLGPHLFTSEVRTVAADDLWLSPCYNQASVAIHFTWKQEPEAVTKLLHLIEKELEPFKARPHWGKLFVMEPQVLASRYEKLYDFKQMQAFYDMAGKFKNDFIARNILGE